MYFLGIDPGLSEVGFGIVRTEEGEPHFVDAGIIRTPAGQAIGKRLSTIKSDLGEILSLHPYAAAGVEELFFVKNISNGIKVAQARGVILESLESHNIPVTEMSPSQVKADITGDGSADKKQMQEMVKRLLKLNSLPRPHDAADALGLAILTARLHKR